MDASPDDADLVRNPLVNWVGPWPLPDFSKISDEDFGPAFDQASRFHRLEIDAIANNSAPPDVENTLVALEGAGRHLSRISSIFWCKAGADTNSVLKQTEREIAPKLSRHFSAITLDEKLFGRIDALYSKRDTLGLDGEACRALERCWKNFMRAGAGLKGADRERFAAINEELAALGTEFSQNVLEDESNWCLMLKDGPDLDGLPGYLRDSMAEAAASRNAAGKFAVTLSRSIFEPFLSFSPRRDLREQVHRAFLARGASKNWPIIEKTLSLRAELAKMLGYESYAAYKLDDTMAKTPDAVMGLLMPVWNKAKAVAAADQSELERIAAAEGNNHPIEAWDWRYYAEKLRSERYDFDEAELKPYLQLENVIKAGFAVAARLFGISFRERPDIAAWHPDVRVFEVLNPDGSRRGVFLGDYFARSSKRSGAWMSALQNGNRLFGDKPVIYNVMNFAKPPRGHPALLSLDEASTLFHEFGHALHGLLTEVTWPSLAGTSVSRDFVELPSQLFEHWLTTPEILGEFATHHSTAQPIPHTLVEKILAAKTFDSGFATVEFAASALIDMAYHQRAEQLESAEAFEAETLSSLGMPSAIAIRHKSPHFQHVFSGGGYAAGYYSYLWSEVLDADAFAAFESTGDVFNPELAARLKEHVYAAGDSRDPEELYKAFRGAMPTPDAMLKKRGLF